MRTEDSGSNAGLRDSTSGEKISIWTRSAETPKYPVAPEGLKPDVCVIGAGISGLTVAYTLACRGASVVVVDDGAIGSGETGRTTAHLASAVDDHYHVLEALHGEKKARMVAESHTAAIDRISAIIVREGIECGFERIPGYLFPAPDEDPGFLQKEMDAAWRAGLRPEMAARAPIPMFETGPALKFPGQAQFHPLRYLAQLAEAVVRRGGRIFTAHAEAIKGGDNAQVTLKSGRSIHPKSIVVATNVPVNNLLAMHTKLEAYRTYVIAAHVPEGQLPKALLWDSGDPYHYVRVAGDADNGPGQDLLIIGGEDHKTGQATDFSARYGNLEMWMRSRYPEAGVIHAKWSGQIIETVDGLAYIGRNPSDEKNVYIVTGDSGNGLTHGTIAGMLIPDLIQGRANPWEETYDPSRLTFKAAGEFGRNALNMAAQLKGWVKGPETAEEKDILPGTGAILKDGLKPVAAYRDEEGNLHKMSAVCPHLKCVVGWNGSERSWDCPCHGSRFDCRGHVTNGPANSDLAHLEQPAQAAPNAAGSEA